MIERRTDIDGLRAIAVMAVILSHAEVPGMASGIVGVDIFFVISGFLITAIILAEQASGKFSLRSFYERRVRRILPALAVVLLVTTVAAWLILLPWELTRYGQSLVSVVLFASNIYFFLTTGYFSEAAAFQPLIHTWSLAVEEQFYILFPLLLMGLWRAGQRWHIPVLVALFLSSLLTWVVLTDSHPKFVFYMLPTRAWQLLVGALLALHFLRPAQQFARVNSTLANAISLAGLLTILLAVTGLAGFGKDSHATSIDSMLAVLGAGLVIAFSQPGTLTHRCLSLPPIVAIGLISYSAYLWHQPVLAFHRHLVLSDTGWVTTGLLIVLTLTLAALTWWLVEQPCRNRSRVSVPKLLRSVVPVSLICLTFGLAAHVLSGEMFRYPEAAGTLLADLDPPLKCDPSPPGSLGGNACWFGKADDSAAVIIWGDSHARALAQGLQALQDELPPFRIALFTHSGCPPILGITREKDGYEDCLELNRRAMNEILAGSPSRVILASRWATSVEAARFDNQLGGKERGEDIFVGDESSNPLQQDAARHDYIRTALQHTISKLTDAGKDVALILPWPEFGWSVPKYGTHHLRFRFTSTLIFVPPVLSRTLVDRRLNATYKLFEFGVASKHIMLLDPISTFCDETSCRSGTSKELWYSDDDHLSPAGVRELVNSSALLALIQGQVPPA